MSTLKTLADLKSGQKGKIISIKDHHHRHHGINQKLQSMGVLEGKIITKVSSQWMRGPVVFRCGKTDIAVGHRMARKILVEEINPGDDN